MKLLDLINEAETDQQKNARHTKDLDDLERDLRKSKTLDKDTKAEINRKRKQLAANKAKMSETTTAGAIASTSNGFAGGGIGTLSRAGTVTKKKKKKSR